MRRLAGELIFMTFFALGLAYIFFWTIDGPVSVPLILLSAVPSLLHPIASFGVGEAARPGRGSGEGNLPTQGRKLIASKKNRGW